MKNELYRWQEECLERWFANGGRGIVQAVTGSGKTLLALTAAERMEKDLGRDLRVKIVVPTSALMRQWHRSLMEFLSDSGGGEKDSAYLRKKIGLRGGGFRSAPVCKYMIYVINSARYELARQILTELKQGEAILLIADECHHYASGQNQLIFEFLPYINQYRTRFFSLGLSATLPAGQSRRYLASVLGNNIYHYGMAEASAGHTICTYDIFHISLSFRPDERDLYEELSERMSLLYRRLLHAYPSLSMLGQSERYELLRSLSAQKNCGIAETAASYMSLSYKRKSLVCLASARTVCTCELVRRLDENGKILIFSERISQTDELYRLLKDQYPERIGRYHSGMGDQANRNTLERFRTGSIRILITCRAIDEGIDVPDASIGIILSGTSTQRQRIQRLGRVLRKSGMKSRALLYYLHIEETSEDACFLPDTRDSRLTELSFDPKTREFANPPYEERAALLLEEMQNAGAGEEQQAEAKRCLWLGLVRSDWKLDKDAIEKKISRAKAVGDKNYWICMKKMNRLLST